MENNKSTYREAITEIEEILAQIENNELDVDQLSEKVKRVSFLITACKDKLKNTEEEIANILKDVDTK